MSTQHGHMAGWDEMGGYGLNMDTAWAGWDEMGECGLAMDTGLDGMRYRSVDSMWTLGWMG